MYADVGPTDVPLNKELFDNSDIYSIIVYLYAAYQGSVLLTVYVIDSNDTWLAYKHCYVFWTAIGCMLRYEYCVIILMSTFCAISKCKH